MTKKGHQKVWRMKIKKIGKGKIGKICHGVRKRFQKWGEIWNRRKMHHCLKGDGRPWYHTVFKKFKWSIT